MARVVNAMPGNNYEQWLDGRVWRLVHGEDFSGLLQTFSSSMHQISSRRGLRLRMRRRTEDGVTVVYAQAVKR